jgi:hypothetical protein
MATPTQDSGGMDRQRIAALVEQFNRMPSSSSAERLSRDEVLDQLQEAVGLSGRMVTEQDILRQASKLLATK